MITVMLINYNNIFLLGLPIINFISSHAVVSEGKEVNLSCIATNDDDARKLLHIRWLNPDCVKIESNTAHLSIRYVNHTVSGQLESILSFYLVNRSDNGEYTCQAFNRRRFYTEKKTNLTVECKFFITIYTCS